MLKLAFLILFSFLCSCSYADDIHRGTVSSITEEDGSPEIFPYQLKTSNGTLTDNSDGTVSLSVAPASQGVTNGDTHDHSGGDGAQINHTTLTNIGTNTHAQVDTHLALTNLDAHGGTATGAITLANIANPIIQQYDNAAWGTNTKKLTFQAGSASSADTITFDAKGNFDYQTTIGAEAGLVSYWKMDNDWQDSKGTNHGTATGATFGTAKYGAASGSFDGTGDYISVPSHASLKLSGNNFTIENWVKFNVITSQFAFLSDWTAGNISWVFYGNASTLLLSYSTDGASVITKSVAWTPQINTWYYIVIARDGANLKFFLNGVQTGATQNIGADVFFTSAFPLYIAAPNAVETWLLNGLIDEVAVYNTALSASTILSHYSGGIRTRAHFKNTGTTNVDFYNDGDIYAGLGNTKIQLTPSVADGATNKAYYFGTESTLVTAGSIHTEWANNTSTLMTLTPTGLGIGITPTVKLHISSTEAGGINSIFQAGDNYVKVNSAGNDQIELIIDGKATSIFDYKVDGTSFGQIKSAVGTWVMQAGSGKDFNLRDGAGADRVYIASSGGIIALGGAFNDGATVNIRSQSTTAPGLIVKGKASATEDIFRVQNSADAKLFLVDENGNVGIGTTAPTAVLHLKAGTATASTAPLKFTSGTLNTTAEAGAIEYLTDDFYGTITTGAARKKFVLDDGTALTSGRVPFATTNGRLTDDADLTFVTDTLTVTKIAAHSITGDVDFVGSGTGLPYGGMYHNTAFTVSVALANTAYEADDGANAFTASPLNNTTFSDHYVSVDKAGTYKIDWSMSVEEATLTGGAADDLEGGIMIDGVANAQGKSHTTVSVQNNLANISCSAIITLTVNQQVSLYVMNHTDDDDIAVEHLGMNILQIGG